MSYKTTTLPNGMKIVTYFMPTVSTTLGVFVGVGSIHEDETEHGLSHFIEHMCFKGTPTRSVTDIADAVEGKGGIFNANTSAIRTCYWAKVLNPDVDSTLEVLIDMTYNSIFDPKELATERNPVKEEIKMYNDKPESIAEDMLQNAIYKNSSYGRCILGTNESLDSFDSDKLHDYVAKWYKPNNSLVVAVGNIEHERIVDIVEKFTNHLKPGSIKTIHTPVFSNDFVHFNKDFEQATLMMAYPTQSGYLSHRTTAVKSMLSQYLSGGMSSPIFYEIREKRGLVYGVGTFSESYANTGLFGLHAGTTGKNVEELLSVAEDIFRNFRNDFDTKGFVRTQNQAKMSIGNMQESQTQVMYYLSSLLTKGRIVSFEDYLDVVNSITPDELIEQSEKIFSTLPAMSVVGNVDDKTIDFCKNVVFNKR